MAEQLGDRVVLNCPVRSITQDADGVTLQTDRGAFRGRVVIVAIPPLLASRIHYASSLPSSREQLMIRMPMGSVIKYVATYDRAFSREAGFSGEAFSDTGPTVTTFDDCSHDGSQPALVSFSDGAAGRIWSDRPADERRRAVLADFARFFGEAGAAAPDFVEKNWSEDPLERGLLCRRDGPRRHDRFRSGHSPALWTDSLGRHRNGRRLDRVYERRDRIGSADGCRNDGSPERMIALKLAVPLQ